ncbi:MAG: acyl carrier protein [Frankiales bacterium]|nr:acyl carrier protein [Frankiales bacterium]
MTAEQVLDLLRSAVVTVLEVDGASLGRGTRFVDDLQADSLALVEIVEIVEEDLTRAQPGFRIADEDLDRLLTLGDAVDYAVARLR